MPKAQKIWLSFDLGIRGDYESFYSWLDQKEAEECGDGLAVLVIPTTGLRCATV